MNYPAIIDKVLREYYGWDKTNELINSEDFPIGEDWDNLGIFLVWLYKKVPEKDFIEIVNKLLKIL